MILSIIGKIIISLMVSFWWFVILSVIVSGIKNEKIQNILTIAALIISVFGAFNMVFEPSNKKQTTYAPHSEHRSPVYTGQGCCSHHSGVCSCSNGDVVCCDGTISPSCSCY